MCCSVCCIQIRRGDALIDGDGSDVVGRLGCLCVAALCVAVCVAVCVVF